MIDIPETINKVRQLGGRVHPRFKGSDAYKEKILRRKCDALSIAPVLVGELD